MDHQTPESDSRISTQDRSKSRGQKTDALLGKTVADKYEIIELIGVGAFGCVYKATHLSLGKIIALKVLHSEYVEDPQIAARFQHEAMMTSRISHPHLVTAFDYGICQKTNTVFMAMEYVPGLSLKKKLDQIHKLDVEQGLNIIMQLCDGMSAAHKQGILHRDIKPSNIMLVSEDNNPNFVKITDFGIAKVLNESEEMKRLTLTATGEVMGTCQYMSPEQCKGQKLDYRSDIYSIGCVLFEILTGNPPFHGGPSTSVIGRHVMEPAPALVLESADSIISSRLATITAKALEKEPSFRYQNADDLRTDLGSVQSRLQQLRTGRTNALLLTIEKLGLSLTQAAKRLNSRTLSKQRTSSTLATIIVSALVSTLTISLLWQIYGLSSCPSSEERSIAWQEPPPSIYESDPKKFDEAEKNLFDIEKKYKLLGMLGTEEGFKFQCLFGEFYLKSGAYFKAAQRFLYAAQLVPHLHLTGTQDAADLALSTAECDFKRKAYANCIKAANDALSNYQNFAESDYLIYSLGSIKGLCYLGQANAALKHYDTATENFQSLVNILEHQNFYVVEPDKTTPYVFATANYFFDRKNYPLAQKLYKYALICPTNDKEQSINHAVILNNLGIVENKLNNYLDAKDCFNRSVKELSTAVGPNDLRIAKILFNEADVLWKLKEWARWFNVQNHARDIWRKR